MTNFRVGMEVVCVDAGAQADKRWLLDAPIERARYVVNRVGEGCDGHTLWLEGMTNRVMRKGKWIEDCGYLARRFRPVQYSTTKAVEALKASLPKLKIRERVES